MGTAREVPMAGASSEGAPEVCDGHSIGRGGVVEAKEKGDPNLTEGKGV